MKRMVETLLVLCLIPSVLAAPAKDKAQPAFSGKHYSGNGDVAYLELLEKARRMFEPDPELQNLAMLYEPKWNGLVEGPTWDAWWIQNSYGTTYSILPLLQEPFITFLQNSQDLWFDQMGDGKRLGSPPPFDWVAPDGALCDAAQPGRIIYKQGDGRTGIHDWGMEFTAAGVLMQAELLLISRDAKALNHYLPKLERSAAFIESRRATNNLFLAGPAGNLLAPSYAGWLRPDGTYDKAYLAGLSVTWIAALDRLIELEKLAGRTAQARDYKAKRDSAAKALPLLTTPEGYLIRSLDPDGTKHGVYGASKHGYFEASPNHDAVAFRVADDSLSKTIFAKLTSIPELRPYDFVIPNYPSYDDMYEKPEGLWAFGTWVNGGHWSTCEGRMILAYYRMGDYESARRSMQRLLGFAAKFRMDNPLTKFGSDVYQPNQPINICYDTFAPAAAMMRGLFEYLYSAEGLTLLPHIPPGIRELHQTDPARFGSKKIFVSTYGTGPVTRVKVNGKDWKRFSSDRIEMPFEVTPAVARVQIGLGGSKIPKLSTARKEKALDFGTLPGPRPAKLGRLLEQAEKANLDTTETAHGRLALRCFAVAAERSRLVEAGQIVRLPEPSHTAAAKSYDDTANKLYEGLDQHMKSGKANDRLRKLWAD